MLLQQVQKTQMTVITTAYRTSNAFTGIYDHGQSCSYLRKLKEALQMTKGNNNVNYPKGN